MELLKKIPSNFRYYLFTTSTKEIVVVYLHMDYNIEDNTITMLESNYIPIFKNRYSIIDNQTIKVTCKDDEIQLKDFNRAIRDYCNARPETTKFSIYSASPTYKILFEADTIKSVFKCTKDVYFELGPEGGFKTGKDDFDQMDKIEIKSGQWFLDEETTIYTKEFLTADLKIDEYNRGAHSSIFNLIISESFKGMRIQLYSTIQFNVVNSSKDPDEFEEGKISFAYINIFGEEILDDNNVARIEFHGFNKINLGCIEVSDEVKYGNILYIDNITKFTLMHLQRKILQINNGSFLQIGRVGSVTLHNIQYNLTDKSTLVDGASIVTFLHIEGDKLERSLNIFNTTMNNSTGRKLVICKVVNTEIKKLYISKCFLSNDVVMLEKDENSKVIKFNYNECTFNSIGNFEINDVIKLSLNNITFNIIGELRLGSPNISINGGKWNVGKLIIDNEKDMIVKIVMNDLLLNAEDIDIRNSTMEGVEDLTFYDSNCSIKANTYHISGYKPSYTKTFFMCNKIDIECLTVSTLSNVKIGFNKNSSILTAMCSLAGSLIFTTSNESNKEFTLKLNDKNLFMNVNTVDFSFADKPSPMLTFEANTPIKYTLKEYSNEYVRFSYLNKPESEQNSKIIYKPSLTNIDHKFDVFNDSEKLCEINKIDDESDQFSNVYEIKTK